jgi:prolyl-tRNA synthetase
LQSYRQLPALLYHVWGPFRDEGRAWGGLFGAREPRLLDGYSLHPDGADLDELRPRVQAAFTGILERCELGWLSVAAGADEDTARVDKLIWPSELGEETALVCAACGYAAEQSIARAAKPAPPAEELLPMQDVETPDCKTIADLARFLKIPEARTAKALFLVAYVEGEGDRFVFVVLRGDTALNEAKLKRVLGAQTVGPATEAEIRAAGAEPGYGSPVGLAGVSVVVDDWIPNSPNLVAGANRPGYHTLNVNYGRDYQAAVVADITLAQEGDGCPECGAPLRAERGVELAALARLDDGYSRELNATYLDQAGQAQPLVVGRYRLYLDRLLAAVAETHHDEHGLRWPAAVAPYQVYLMTLGKRSEAVEAAAGRLYAELSAAGVDVLFDDRDERAGVKFNDADLLGLPLRVAAGERGLQSGSVELKRRGAAEVEAVPLEDVTRRVLDYLGR